MLQNTTYVIKHNTWWKKNLETPVNELLKERPSGSLKLIIVKTCNPFNGYVPNFTHNQVIQNRKNKLCT